MFLLSASSSFGKYASMPMGWIFMAAIVLIEALVMSYVIRAKRFDTGVMLATTVSNVASAVAGSVISKVINDGWMLVVWFPWVSMVEVDTSNSDSLFEFAIYLVGAFVGTVLIELIINGLLLRRHDYFKSVAVATVISNVISYIVGCTIMYTYSFLFFE